MASPAQAKFDLKAPYEAPKLEVELDEVREFARLTDSLHQAIRDAVDEVGHKEVAFIMDIEGSSLSNLINCRDLGNGKHQQPPARLLLLLGKRQKSQRLARMLAKEWGFAPPLRAVELSPEEELRRLKETLRAEGSFGVHVLEKAIGSAK